MAEEKESENDRPHIGDMVAELLSFWAFGPDAYASEHNVRYHPVKLVVWTVVAIAVVAGLSAARVAFFGEPTGGWAVMLFPLLLPLTGALAHRPPGYAGGLVSGVAAGLFAALLLGIDFGTTLSGFWAGLAAVCAGFLVCSVVFAAVTWPRPEPPPES
ncbi:MAG TPA: hypothetical protein VFV66_29150 [Nonomuraea sp.]|nr:hypothetical protein [Nonomuraea sp.]